MQTARPVHNLSNKK